jgi:hypothetical protein
VKQKLKHRVHAKRRSVVAPRRKKVPRYGAGGVHAAEDRLNKEKAEFNAVLFSPTPEDAVPFAKQFVKNWPRVALPLAWSCVGSALYVAELSIAEAKECFRTALRLDPTCVAS